MQGYVGQRARKRKFKFFLFFVILFFLIIVSYLLTKLKVNENTLSETLLPTQEEIITTQTTSTIQDLEFKVFNQEQKIIFRNNQIQKLKEQMKSLLLENQKLLETVKNLNNILDSSSKNENLIEAQNELNKKTTKDALKDLEKLKKNISKLKIEKNDLLKNIAKYNTDINSINKELKKSYSNNLKLKNLNKQNNKNIKELKILIEEKNLIIKLLKNKNPHG